MTRTELTKRLEEARAGLTEVQERLAVATGALAALQERFPEDENLSATAARIRTATAKIGSALALVFLGS